MQALLASLAVSLSVNDTAYKAGMATARSEAKRTGQDFEREGERMGGAMRNAARDISEAMVSVAENVAAMSASVTRAGIALTAGISAPLILMGRASKNTAASFEAAMNGVRAALLSASPREIEKLTEAALEMGPAFGRSAIEAAGAMEALAKNGMSASAILNGGLNSALTLAVVGQTDLSKAADLTTDLMAQFGKTTGQLPQIVDKVSGALDASKMAFDDYRLAIGQAGGFAGKLGYTFDDMNTALAATAPMFDAGSDAGTSFRSFLSSLAGKSKESVKAMEDLGMSFYETSGAAKGQARSIADIARELEKLRGQSHRARTISLEKIFGSDGGRTALALMELGFEGVADAAKKIEVVTAKQKMAVLMQGDAKATAALESAMEKLSIQIGNVLLPVVTWLKNSLAGLITALASGPPWFYKLAVAAGFFAAAIGPLTIAVVAIAKVGIPLLVARFVLLRGAITPATVAIALLLNPLGLLVRGMAALAGQMAVTATLGRLAAVFGRLAGPVGLVITLLAVLGPLFLKNSENGEKLAEVEERLAAAHAEEEAALAQLKSATGRAKDEALQYVKALRAQRVESLQAAKAAMVLARAEYHKAKVAEMRTPETGTAAGAFIGLAAPALLPLTKEGKQAWKKSARKDLGGTIKETAGFLQSIENIDRGIADAMKPLALNDNVSFDDEKSDRKAKADDARRSEDRFQDELGRLRVAQLELVADINGSIQSRYEATVAGIAEERASYERQLNADESLNAAKRKVLLGAKDEEAKQQKLLADQEYRVRLAADAAQIAQADLRDSEDIARSQMDLADTAKDRRRIALRLVDLAHAAEEAAQLEIFNSEASSDAQKKIAFARLQILDELKAGAVQKTIRDTEGPAESYLRNLRVSADAVAESIEASGVSALSRFNDELADAVLGAGNLAKAFANMAQSIVRDIVRIGMQRAIIEPLANALFGKGEGGAGGLLGSIGRMIGGSAGPDMGAIRSAGFSEMAKLGYGGGKASGGRVSPGSWYMVGENGPEPFIPDSAGTIHPNSSLGRREPVEIKVYADEGAMFVPRVEMISNEATSRGMGEVQRRQERMGRRRLGR